MDGRHYKKSESFGSEYTANTVDDNTTNSTTTRVDSDQNYINFHKGSEEDQNSGVLGLKKKRKLVSKGGTKNNSIVRTQTT